MRLRDVWLWVALLTTQLANSQSIGIGTTSPHPSAQLDIFSNNKGLLIPRLTTAQRNAIVNPAHSLIIFNIDNFCIEAYDSVSKQWLAVSCPATCNPCDTCPLPVIDSITGPQTLCTMDTAVFKIWTPSQGAFIWNVDSSWTILSTGQYGIFIAGQPATVYGYLCNECGCVGDSLAVQMGTAPVLTSIIQNPANPVCPADTIVLKATTSGTITSWSWTVPTDWTVIGPTNLDSLLLQGPAGDTATLWTKVCNDCGCDSASITIEIQNASLSVSISGPTFACSGDTIVWKASAPGATTWIWQYPPLWTLIVQSGDSIVLMPDTTDGQLIVQVSDGCAIGSDTLRIISDVCRTLCLVVGGTGYDRAEGAVRSTDKGIVIAGRTSLGQNPSTVDVYVVKIDTTGSIVWSNTIGGNNNDYALDITRTRNGEFIAVGITESFGFGGEDVYVVHIDSAGNVTRSWVIGGAYNDRAHSVTSTTDGGFAITGCTYSFCNTGCPSFSDIYVIKVSPAGNVEWTRTIGGQYSDCGTSIIETFDSGFIVVGSGAAEIVKLNKNGSIEWAKLLSNVGPTVLYSVIETSDKYYVATGYVNVQGNYEVYVIKFDSLGNTIWSKVIGGSSTDIGYSVMETATGAYVIAGSTFSLGQGSNDVYVIKIDSNGNLLWASSVGGPLYDEGFAILPGSGNDDIVVVGQTSGIIGSNDIYLFTLNKHGFLKECYNCFLDSGGNISSGGGTADVAVYTSSGGFITGGGSVSQGGSSQIICR